MRHPINEQAITVSVGQFIREVRNGNKRPSMFNILKSNGVTSSDRARQLVTRMIENRIIHKHRDSSYSLCKENYDMAEVMPALLKREYRKRVKKTLEESTAIQVIEEISPLSSFHAQDLVNELRNRGYEVKATRQVMITEEL